MVTYPTSNPGDVGSKPIRGNMFFFQNLFHTHTQTYIYVCVCVYIYIYSYTPVCKILHLIYIYHMYIPFVFP